MPHVGNMRAPNCIFMLGDHTSTTANPWLKQTALNCENQQNFTSKIWFNLELGACTMGQLGNLVPPKCMFTR
jgi:hypothetical protein